MITTRFLGRLGNSMFQIAAAVGYARKYGFEYGFPSYDHRRGQPWESGIWNCWPNLPKWESTHYQTYNEHPNEFCPVHGVHKDVCHYDYHDIPHRGDNLCLVGFFQSLKYFEHVQDEVKGLFPLPHVPGYEDYVSIHVRRGDYVQYSGSFPPITMDYVEKAMAKIRSQKYLVFSDDIPWCKQNFAHLNNSIQHIEFSEGLGEKEDMSLMASCGHHIIANSSFSWWGAYLGHNKDKVIVCPSQRGFNWYGPQGGVKDPKTLIPDGWIQIEFR